MLPVGNPQMLASKRLNVFYISRLVGLLNSTQACPEGINLLDNTGSHSIVRRLYLTKTKLFIFILWLLRLLLSHDNNHTHLQKLWHYPDNQNLNIF